jgi:hypothetical protein
MRGSGERGVAFVLGAELGAELGLGIRVDGRVGLGIVAVALAEAGELAACRRSSRWSPGARASLDPPPAR